MYILVLLLQHAMPTAINMVTILVLHGYGEDECAAIVFWEYILSVASVTGWIAVFMAVI